MKPGMGFIDLFLFQPHQFYQKSPDFEGKWTSFEAVLTKNTCMCAYRPGLYYPKVNIG